MGLVRAATSNSLQELAALVGSFGGSISYVAGGTDLLITLENGPQPDLIIDISRMEELDFIDTGIEAVRIGAATPVSALAEHHELVVNLPILTQAARQVGSVQIRNRATIGGNIASAVPGGDLLPVLKCLDCQIDALRRDQTMTTHAFDEVVVGAGKTCLGNGDMITAIRIPLRFGKNRVSAFGKIGRRRELAIARLNLAVLADYESSANRINRCETFTATRTRSKAIGHVQTAVDNKGRILARDTDVLVDVGAYCTGGMFLPGSMLQRLCRLYNIENQHYRGRSFYTNTLPSGAYRGYGSPRSMPSPR